MRGVPRGVKFAGIVVLAGLFLWWLLALAAFVVGEGPWRGQVVDADTGRPLSDVVVVAVWYLAIPGPVHEGKVFQAADEVVTDAAGRFELPARRYVSWIPFTGIRAVHRDVEGRLPSVGLPLAADRR